MNNQDFASALIARQAASQVVARGLFVKDSCMSYEMSVVFTDDYVEARSIGDKSYQTAVALRNEILKVCDEHNCYKVLGIGKSTSKGMPTMDAMQHEKLFKDFAITRKFQIAWVELNKEAFGSIKFLETVLLDRGMLNGMLFSTVEETRQWSLDE